MRKLIRWFAVLPCLLTAGGCASVDAGLRNTVVLHYQHVANVHRIDFTAPLTLPQRAEPVHAVLPLESGGFWAVFLLCSLDASGANIPSFYFDLDRLYVAYGKQRYGPLRPYTLRLDDTADLNSRFDTPALRDAIALEIQRGPTTQVFRHGYYPRLAIRFAIYVPRALSDYSGDQLTLRYDHPQAMALGNDVPPSDIPFAGASGSGIAAVCLP